MAGQVADSACRHFIRRFGEALFHGEPLVKAAADGRRVAHINSLDAESSVDWAFPAIFLAEQVDPAFTPITAKKDDTAELIVTLTKNFNLADKLVFCHRLEFFQAYEKLFSSVHKPVLVAYVKGRERGLGKSRLLKELAAHAIRDGHIPVFLIHGSDKSNYPKNLEQLRCALADQLDRTAECYDLEGAVWKLLALRPDDTGRIDSQSEDLPQKIRNYLVTHDHTLSLYLLFWALREDLNTLVAQARVKNHYVREQNGHAILLLDDVDAFGKEFLEDCFDENAKVLTSYGLGKDEINLIPLVMTVNYDGAPGEALHEPFKDRSNSYPWLRALELKPFDEAGDEDLLAYQQVYLNPYELQVKPVPDISNFSLVINFAAKKKNPEVWESWRTLLSTIIKGIPSRMKDPYFYPLASHGKALGNLILADEVDQLKKYME
jgi:hypothetical protein